MRKKKISFTKILNIVILISVITSPLFIILERFIVVRTKYPAKIIKEYSKGKKVTLVVKTEKKQFHITIKKEMFMKIPTKKGVYVYYSKFLKVPCAISSKNQFMKLKFEIHPLIYGAIFFFIMVIFSLDAIKTDVGESSNKLLNGKLRMMDADHFTFYVLGILSLGIWVCIIHEIFK